MLGLIALARLPLLDTAVAAAVLRMTCSNNIFEQCRNELVYFICVPVRRIR